MSMIEKVAPEQPVGEVRYLCELVSLDGLTMMVTIPEKLYEVRVPLISDLGSFVLADPPPFEHKLKFRTYRYLRSDIRGQGPFERRIEVYREVLTQ